MIAVFAGRAFGEVVMIGKTDRAVSQKRPTIAGTALAANKDSVPQLSQHSSQIAQAGSHLADVLAGALLRSR